MYVSHDTDGRVMIEVVPATGAGSVQRRANCAVQYRYLDDRAGIGATIEYVPLRRGFLDTCQRACRGLSAPFLWIGARLANVADVLAATDERRQRAGYE